MLILAALVFLLFTAAYFVLQNEQLQSRVVCGVTGSLEEKTGADVSLSRIDWNFPNAFVINQLYVSDEAKDTLLYVERAKVTLNILPLFHKTISFRTIQVTEADARVKYLKDQKKYNYDFLVEAFSTPNDTASIDWGFDLESLAFTDCRMDFVADKSVVPVDSVFCPQHVSLNDINGALFIKESMFDNTQEFRLHRLHFKERSGLELSNLSALLTVADNEIRLEDFVTQTQNSQLYLPQALISHSNVRGEDIAKLADSKIDIVLDPSNIHLADFSPLVRSFRNSKDDVRLSGTISGTRHEMYLKSFLVDMGETMTLDAEVKATEIFDIDSLGIDANLKSITLTADDARRLGQLLVDRPIYLPPVADSLGLLKFSGLVYGKFKELYAEGLLSTDGGSISTDVVVKAEDNKYERFGIVGATTARDFDLTRLFGKESGLGKTAFELEVDIQKVEAEKFDMELEGRIDTLYFKDYLYQGISLAGKLNDRKYTGNFSLKDDNISCEFEGSIDMKHRDMPVMNFMANVKDANIDKLNWINSSEPITVSFDITTNSSGKTLDDLSGSVTLDNFLCTRGDKYLYLNLFTLNTEAMKNGKKKIHVISDYINGSVEGKYSFATLLDNIKRITYSYLPTLKEMDTKYVASNEPSPANDFKFNFTLENTEPINDIIELPIVVQQKSVVKGFINDSTGKFQLRFEAPLFVYNENIVEDALLLVENPHDELKVVCRSTYADPDKRRYPYYLSLNSSAKNDNLDLRLSFSNSEEVTYSGNLSMKTALRGYTKDGLSADISIIPSKVVIKDSVWSIGAGEIELRPKLLDVKRFEVENKYQKFHAKGRTTDLKNDSLRIWFTDLDVTHFSNILDNKFITFGGVGDGDFYLTKLFSNPTVEGRLGLFDAYLNNYPFGDLEAEFGYDAKSNTMIFGTNVVSAYETHEKSIIDGAVYFDEDSLFIDGRLRDIDMRFLRVYLDGVLSNNTGVLNTHVLALGHFNNIGLEGMGLVRDFDFNIDYTDVKYTFTDTVWMTQNSFRLDGIKIKDMEGNSGQLSALILHEGFLHWKYAVNVDTDNLLALNTTENDNDLFYGKAYVAGKVGVSGSGDELNLNLDVKTNKDSKFVVPLDGAKGVNDAGFITFKKSSKMTTQEMRRVRREKIQKIKQEEDETPLIVNLNADIDATPDAQVSLILDKKLGDVIRARGNGSLSFSYDGRDDLFKLFGQYQITKGDYLFTIQSVIARKFELLNGSTVRWNGDPTAANVDINAKYTLNAYVGDILAEDNVTTTMVNCLMDISGTISQPQVKFDLNMPNIDDDMMRKVRSVINTDEAMNRNVASLLAFGTFNIGDVGTSSSQNMSSMGFAALSSEISGLLSKINNDVNVGLNYRPYTEDQTSARTEFEVALSTGLLNDRLILNGNFGYREGMSSFDATNYSGGIADVDIEYKLSPNGRFRAKAFNRSSNSYLREFNSQTQGVGLLYRHDYDNAEELISTYISPFKKIFGKRRKNKEENEEDNKKE